MALYRQAQIVIDGGSQGLAAIDLNTAPYKLEAGSWRSEQGRLRLVIVVTASTLVELDRSCAALRQRLALAEAYHSALHYQPVYVYQKTCDALSDIALSLLPEIGATWMRKRVMGGRMTVEDASIRADRQFTVRATMELDVDEMWQRVTPEPVAVATYGLTYLTVRSDGGLTTSGASELSVQRLRWTSSTGLTVRMHWQYGGSGGVGKINFVKVSSNMRCYWGASGNSIVITDDTGIGHSASVSFVPVVGQTYDLVVRWSSASMSVYVDGTRVAHYDATTVTWPSNPETYLLMATEEYSGTHHMLSAQVWPTSLSDAQIAALVAWGQPESELAFLTPPTDTKLTHAFVSIYNVPGDGPARLRLAVDGSQSWDKLAVGLRLLSASTTALYECESGTLGANTASNSNSDASGGSQARFTPADTSWATRVTRTLASAPVNVEGMRGTHRLFLAGYDSAAAVQMNMLRWRLVIAGVAGDWSDEFAFGAVATRSLLDMGTVTIPPGAWPDESMTANTNVEGSGAYVKLELDAKNTAGSGGGTLDMDALYLAPAEQELTALCTSYDATDEWIVLDFCSQLPCAVTVRDLRSLEWATWVEMSGDVLELAPRAALSGFLWLFGYRDSDEQAFPNDTISFYVYYRPEYER